MTTSHYKGPLPIVEKDDKPFWEAAKRHELVIQRCTVCKTFHHPPVAVCNTNSCQGDKCEFVKLSGRGTLYTFVVMHQPMHPAFAL